MLTNYWQNKLCCTNCFQDYFLIDYINDNGSLDVCDYCGSEDINCINVRDLSDLFRPVIYLYEPVENFLPTYELKNLDFVSERCIWDILQDEWEIFADASEDCESIIRDMFSSHRPDEDEFLLDSVWQDSSKYWGTDIEYNDKLKADWDNFRAEIIYKNRYFPNNYFDIDIIKRLLPLLVKNFPLCSELFRAQNSDHPSILPISRLMKPLAKYAKSGRANPAGIPYFYTASTPFTSIKEVRPKLGKYVSVATFVCKTTLNLIDLRNPKINSPFEFGDMLEHFLMHLAFLNILGNELSIPVTPDDEIFNYIPSQFVCELIKNNAYNGVIYQSSLGVGYNVVLFDDIPFVEHHHTNSYYVRSSNDFELIS